MKKKLVNRKREEPEPPKRTRKPGIPRQRRRNEKPAQKPAPKPKDTTQAIADLQKVESHEEKMARLNAILSQRNTAPAPVANKKQSKTSNVLSRKSTISSTAGQNILSNNTNNQRNMRQPSADPVDLPPMPAPLPDDYKMSMEEYREREKIRRMHRAAKPKLYPNYHQNKKLEPARPKNRRSGSGEQNVDPDRGRVLKRNVELWKAQQVGGTRLANKQDNVELRNKRAMYFQNMMNQ